MSERDSMTDIGTEKELKTEIERDIGDIERD
jgi:hypothetical protein